MAILNVRNLPDDVHAKLRVRAAKAGRSMEAEARAILIAAIQGELIPRTRRRNTTSQAAKHYAALMSHLGHVQAGRKFSREEMNERH
jgi:plasmid stability protein